MPNDLDDMSLIDALEAFYERYRSGLPLAPEQFRDRLGSSYEKFMKLVGIEHALEEAMDPAFDDDLQGSFGSYRILHELGRGAVGIVYAAHDERLDRRVALKVLKPGLEADARARQRWQREARHLAGVRHDHVVEVYEAGEHEGRLFYAMALVEGEPLADRARAKDATSRESLCSRLADVADALHALHEAGVVHRDVKPSNVIVRPDGKMLLADFGLARHIQDAGVTKTGELLGTPLYMSPEQMLGRSQFIDGRTDVYALGVSLYELLVGTRPFHAEDLRSLHRMILQDRPTPPRRLDPAFPADLERIILKCLEKRPEDRYATAADLARDLRAYAQGRTVTGRPVSAVKRRWREVLTHPVAASVAALVLVALVVLGSRELVRPSTGRLVLTSLPSGEVSVAGGAWQSTPLSLELDPGRVEVRVRSPGFEERVQVVDVEAGSSHELVVPLPLSDPSDTEAMKRLLEAHDLPAIQIAQIDGERGPTRPPLQLVYPRGQVRVEDCGTCRVDTEQQYEGTGRIVFRIADAEIAAIPFGTDDAEYENRLPIPDAVRAALAPGVRVVWAYEEDGVEQYRADFEIVTIDLEAQLERVAALPVAGTEPAQASAVKLLARVHLFLERGLATAAFLELEAITAGDATADLLKSGGVERMGLELALESLRRMLPEGAEDVLMLRTGSRLMRTLVELKRGG